MLEFYKNAFIWRRKVDLKDINWRLTEERGNWEREREDRQPPQRGLVRRKRRDQVVARGEYFGLGVVVDTVTCIPGPPLQEYRTHSPTFREAASRWPSAISPLRGCPPHLR